MAIATATETAKANGEGIGDGKGNRNGNGEGNGNGNGGERGKDCGDGRSEYDRGFDGHNESWDCEAKSKTPAGCRRGGR